MKLLIEVFPKPNKKPKEYSAAIRSIKKELNDIAPDKFTVNTLNRHYWIFETTQRKTKVINILQNYTQYAKFDVSKVSFETEVS